MNRILVATDAWLPQINGVVTTVKHLKKEAEKSGHEILVVEPSMFPGFPCPWYPEIKVSLPRKVEKIIDDFNPTHIHLVTEGSIGLAVRNYCVKRKYSFTSSFHTNFAEYAYEYFKMPQSWTWRYLKWFHRDSSAIYISNDKMKEKLTKLKFKRSLVLMERGVDKEVFFHEKGIQKVPRDPNKITVLSVGRVSAEKNLDEFCSLSKVMKGVTEDNQGTPEFECIVAGRGPILIDLKKKYPLVHFVGALEDKELALIYKCADVFVFPSLTDTFGLVLLEALASGIPIVGHSDQPGPQAVIKEGVNGYFYNNEENLLTAIRKAVKLNSNVVATTSEKYDWGSVTKVWLNNLILKE